MSEMPSIEFLYECFTPDFQAGTLTWNERPRHHFETDRAHKTWNTRFAGKRAGSINAEGYRRIKGIGSEHRILWTMFFGAEPIATIDHIDRDKSNNKISNLRCANLTAQNANKELQRNNSSGHRGVGRHKGRWRARISHEGRLIDLGYHPTLEEAVQAYQFKARELFGEFSPV